MRHLNSFCRVSLVMIFLQIGIFETDFFVSFSIYAMTHTIHLIKTILWPNESSWSELSPLGLYREWYLFEIRLFETNSFGSFSIYDITHANPTPQDKLWTFCLSASRYVRHGVCVTVARLFLTSLLGLEWRRQLAPARNQIRSQLVCCSGLRGIAACWCVLLCIPRWYLHEIRSDQITLRYVIFDEIRCERVHGHALRFADEIRLD